MKNGKVVSSNNPLGSGDQVVLGRGDSAVPKVQSPMAEPSPQPKLELLPEPSPTAGLGTKPAQSPDKQKIPVTLPVIEKGEKNKKRKNCNDICADPLPIKWPRKMPLPGERRPLVRTPSNDEFVSPDKRSKPQRDLQEEIREAREKNIPPPSPCFANDAEPNAPYDAHHIHPLYLGGAEDDVNLCSLRADKHQRAHPELNNQSTMHGTNAIWINCKVCSGHLPDHLGQQEYEIDGRK
jgi:hypothetical protein